MNAPWTCHPAGFLSPIYGMGTGRGFLPGWCRNPTQGGFLLGGWPLSLAARLPTVLHQKQQRCGCRVSQGHLGSEGRLGGQQGSPPQAHWQATGVRWLGVGGATCCVKSLSGPCVGRGCAVRPSLRCFWIRLPLVRAPECPAKCASRVRPRLCCGATVTLQNRPASTFPVTKSVAAKQEVLVCPRRGWVGGAGELGRFGVHMGGRRQGLV